MSHQDLHERFFEALLQGDRNEARDIVDGCLMAGITAERVIERLFWPALETLQRRFRGDQISTLAHHYAARLLRMLSDQVQLRLEMKELNGEKTIVMCGPAEAEELAGQMICDLLEAEGFEVYFAGGGVANDEIIAELGEQQPRALVVFCSAPSDLPFIRELIDHIKTIDSCPDAQIAVGGGVFNRAEGLAEEIGADLWAATPWELVQEMVENPDRRAGEDQRSVGRRRRQRDAEVSAA